MKVLQVVTFPHGDFNASVRDGSVGTKINRILESIKTGVFLFHSKMGNEEQFWFLTPTDLKNAGLDELGKKWE
jgi:hypothetical protein